MTQLDPVASSRRHDPVQVGERSNARGLVEHDQQRRIERPTRRRRPLERRVQDLAHNGREHRGQPFLLSCGRAAEQGAGTSHRRGQQGRSHKLSADAATAGSANAATTVSAVA